MAKRKPSARTLQTMQEVAAEILTVFSFVKDMDGFRIAWKSVFEMYGLHYDPYTGCPCSDVEFGKNFDEYQRDLMFERYGHCDGL